MSRTKQRNNALPADKGASSREEFDRFFKTHYATFISFACRYCLNEEEARDIVQDVFVSFWEQRANFPTCLAAKTFCYRSISNRVINYLKHEDVKARYANGELQKMQSEEFTIESVIREEVSAMLHAKIKELTPSEQKIILLTLQNKSNQEIAELLQISLPTVKSHKMHAYAKLRTELKELRFLLYSLLFAGLNC